MSIWGSIAHTVTGTVGGAVTNPLGTLKSIANSLESVSVSYDAEPHPSSINVGLQLGISSDGKKLTATLEKIDTFTVTLTPTGSFSDLVGSAFAYPIAAELAAALPPLLANSPLIHDISIDLVTIGSTTQTIFGQQVTVQPSNLQIAVLPSEDLMLSGDLALTVAP